MLLKELVYLVYVVGRDRICCWRIDYFIVSKSIEHKVNEATIYSETLGSDHCPVGLEIEI